MDRFTKMKIGKKRKILVAAVVAYTMGRNGLEMNREELEKIVVGFSEFWNTKIN